MSTSHKPLHQSSPWQRDEHAHMRGFWDMPNADSEPDKSKWLVKGNLEGMPHKSDSRGFPGGPVVRTPNSHCWGSGFSLWSELQFHKLCGMAQNRNDSKWIMDLNVKCKTNKKLLEENIGEYIYDLRFADEFSQHKITVPERKTLTNWTLSVFTTLPFIYLQWNFI